MSAKKRLRLFLDSNILTGGLISVWGLDRALLSLCAARICKMVLAEAVRDELEVNLLLHSSTLEKKTADKLLGDYTRLVKLCRPEIVPYPSEDDINNSRKIIRHAADVPVLLSATASKPDWLLTHNTKHFSPDVAKRTQLQIATPVEFFSAFFAR